MKPLKTEQIYVCYLKCMLSSLSSLSFFYQFSELLLVVFLKNYFDQYLHHLKIKQSFMMYLPLFENQFPQHLTRKQWF